MSKERARRRAEREATVARERATRQRQTRQARRRRTVLDAPGSLRSRLPAGVRHRGQQGLLARRRRMQNGIIVLLFLAVQAVVWLFFADPWVRGAAAVVGVLAVPVLVTLALDRRPHS